MDVHVVWGAFPVHFESPLLGFVFVDQVFEIGGDVEVFSEDGLAFGLADVDEDVGAGVGFRRDFGNYAWVSVLISFH